MATRDVGGMFDDRVREIVAPMVDEAVNRAMALSSATRRGQAPATESAAAQVAPARTPRQLPHSPQHRPARRPATSRAVSAPCAPRATAPPATRVPASTIGPCPSPRTSLPRCAGEDGRRVPPARQPRKPRARLWQRAGSEGASGGRLRSAGALPGGPRRRAPARLRPRRSRPRRRPSPTALSTKFARIAVDRLGHACSTTAPPVPCGGMSRTVVSESA
jgi:hypothetical protein